VSRASGVTIFLGGLLAVALVAAATFGVVQVLGLDEDEVAADGDDPAIEAPTDADGATVLRADQIEVTGLATAITVEGSTLDLVATPLTVTGGQATIHDVEVDGELVEVVWDGGRPFVLEGAGGLIPQAVNLFAEPNVITVGFVDEVVNEIEPGSYGLETPVAIGREGVAIARDAVPFSATVESTVVFRGGATTSMLPRELSFESDGRVILAGGFEVRRPDGTTAAAAGVELPEGSYRLTATPRPDGTGYDVTALLQGAVTVT
jgi:hypothetical protein